MSKKIKLVYLASALIGLSSQVQADTFETVNGVAVLDTDSVDVNLGQGVQEFISLQFELLSADSVTAASDLLFRVTPSSIGTPNQVITTRTIVSGGSEVPAVMSTAAAIANIAVNTSSGEVTGRIDLTNIVSVTAAHVHMAAAGSNGPILFPLSVVGASGNSTDPGSDIVVVPSGTMLSAENIATFMEGGLYINIHTTANPSGELRGQIQPTIARTSSSELNGNQEVPAVATEAMGFGGITLDLVTGAISGVIRVNGIEPGGVAAAHIHQAAAGSNGSIILNLLPDGAAVAANGTITVPAGSVLTPEQVSAMVSGGTYFNVHTPANPSGEIRGQIIRDVRR